MTDTRTLEQNSFFWALINDIAAKEEKDVEAIYIQLLEEADIKSVKAIIRHNDLEDLADIAARYKIIKQEIVMHVVYDTVQIFKGSSEFSKAEMSRLIDRTISHALKVGISSEFIGGTNDN